MLRILTAVLFVSLFLSCSSSDNSEGEPVNTPTDGGNDGTPDSEVSYSTDIRPIIQGNCVSCHSDPPVNEAPMPLTTYDQVRSAAANRNLLNRINSTTNPMPPSGRLPQAARDLIALWIQQGYPE